MANSNQSAKRNAEVPASVDHAEIDGLMRRFFEENRSQDVEGANLEVVPTTFPDARPRRDFDMASKLLERASQAFDLLMGRCQQLEADLDEANEHARSRAADHASTVEQWKRLASGLKAQLEASEQAAAGMKAHCDAAEARAAMAERRVSALERASAQAASHAALAECLSTKLHDKVVSAFGIGSRAHPVLEAVATKAPAD